MLTEVPPNDCQTARQAASLRVDGELSELEAFRLDAHLLGCPDCRLFAGRAESLARLVRAAVPEEPPTSFVLSPPRRLSLSSWTAAACLVVAVAGSSFALGHVIGTRSPAEPVAFGQTDALRLHQDSAHQHALALLNAFVLPRPQFGPMRAI
jgi:predicted anti-sigma-YlaC factor YlaD